ncbi:MAG: PIN domain-containing protein [Cellvibrionales bacterium]|nr:PIN domain-containing protein [Cellvibrionales bacterium]
MADQLTAQELAAEAKNLVVDIAAKQKETAAEHAKAFDEFKKANDAPNVLLDANVLYSAPLRDALLELAVTDLFKAKWTTDIHCEWINALLRNEPHLDRSKLERARDIMDQNVQDCLIEGYESLIPSLELPDADDRHVLAAAIVGHCDVIITQNLKDFPATALTPFGIEAQHPDEFFCNQLSLAPGLVCAALRKVRARLKNPPKTIEE